jgi:hypothetical protein
VVPTLPQLQVNTAIVTPPGPTVTVGTCGGTTLQDTINTVAANPLGGTIKILHTLDCTGAWTLPARSGPNWVIIETDVPGALPAPGNRVALSDAVNMPVLRNNSGSNPIFQIGANASFYRIIGIKIQATTTFGTYNNVIISEPGGTSTATVPNHIIFDRVINAGTGNANFARRGFYTTGNNIAIINSYVYNFYDPGTDAQAIGVIWGPGPMLFDNNFLEAAGQSILTGGNCLPSVAFLPNDLTITRNYMYKPVTWKSDDPSYDGINRTIKNAFELKLGIRILAQGNVINQVWAAAQNGFPVLFTVRNQDNTCSFAEVSDVTFRLNKIKNVGRDFNTFGQDGPFVSQQSKRMLWQNNLSYLVNPTKWLTSAGQSQLLGGWAVGAAFDHNTYILSTAATPGLGGDIVFDSATKKWVNFWSSNNLVVGNSAFGGFTIIANNDGVGTSALANSVVLPYTVTDNIWWDVPGICGSYPAGNQCLANVAAVGFTNATTCANAGDSGCVLTGGSPGHNAGTDGTDIGVNWSAVNAATAGVEVGP